MPSRHVFERGILKNRVVVSIAFTKLIVIIYLGVTDILIFLQSLSIIQTICLSSCEIMTRFEVEWRNERNVIKID